MYHSKACKITLISQSLIIAIVLINFAQAEHALSEVWSDNDGIQMKFSTDHEMGAELSLKRDSSSPSSAASQQLSEAVEQVASNQQQQMKSHGNDNESDSSSAEAENRDSSGHNQDKSNESNDNDNDNDDDKEISNKQQQQQQQNLSFKSASEQVGDSPSGENNNENNNEQQQQQAVQEQTNLNDEDQGTNVERQQEMSGARFKSPGRLFQQALRMTVNQQANGENSEDTNGNLNEAVIEQREQRQFDASAAPSLGPLPDEPNGEMDDLINPFVQAQGANRPILEDRKSTSAAAATPTSNGRKFLSNFELNQAGIASSKPRSSIMNNVDESDDNNELSNDLTKNVNEDDNDGQWPTLSSGSETSKTQQKLQRNLNSSNGNNNSQNKSKQQSTPPRYGSVVMQENNTARQMQNIKTTKQSANLPQGNYFRNVATISNQRTANVSPDEVRDEFISPGHFPGSMAHLTQAASEQKPISEQKQQQEVSSSKIDATIVKPINGARGTGSQTTETILDVVQQQQVTPEPAIDSDAQQLQIMAPALITTTTPMPRASQEFNKTNSTTSVVIVEQSNGKKFHKLTQTNKNNNSKQTVAR